MTDRIDFGSEPWQAIPRRVLRDSRLTARAKGGLVTLLSHEEGWVRSSIAVLMNECRIGRKQAQAIMAELRELGYAVLVSEREGNLLKTHYVVLATPEGAGSQQVWSAALTYREPTRTGTVPAPHQPAVVEPQDVQPLEEEPRTTNLAPRRERDPIWDVFVDSFGEPTATSRGAWNAAAAVLRDYDADPEEIRDFVNMARGGPNAWAVVTPTAVAKHYGSRLSLVRADVDPAARLLARAATLREAGR